MIGKRIGALLGVGLLIVLGACGGGASSNGEAKKPASQVLADAKAAMLQLQSFHVAAEAVVNGQPDSIDLVVAKTGGGGSITVNGASTQFLRAGGELYLKADKALLEQYTHKPAIAQLMANRWLKVPATNAAYADLGGLVDASKIMTQLKPEGSISIGAVTNVDGKKVIPLTDATGSTLYVAATGTPYIVKVVDTGRSSNGSGSFTFDEYNKAIVPPVPNDAIDLAQLKNS
jgi:hypothetical protein